MVDFAAQIVDINGNHFVGLAKVRFQMCSIIIIMKRVTRRPALSGRYSRRENSFPVRSILLRSVRLVVASIELEVTLVAH